MNPELENLFQEWEEEEKEYLQYLKTEIDESIKHESIKHESLIKYESLNLESTQEVFNIYFCQLYLNIIIYCMKFIVYYVNNLMNNKIDKNKAYKTKIDKNKAYKTKIDKNKVNNITTNTYKPNYFIDELD